MAEHEEFLNSERSAKVVLEAAKGEKGTTSSKISEKYDISQPAASRVIGNLKSKNFLEKGERTKSQFYKPNYEGIAEYGIEQMSQYNEDDITEDVKGIYHSLIAEVLIFSDSKTILYDLMYSSVLMKAREKERELQSKIDDLEWQDKSASKEKFEREKVNDLIDYITEYINPK